MSIAQFEGKALVFNNGVVDVRQGDVSLVDENKVAHIPESGNVEIDNLTIIKNADDELEVPFDNNTIYRDPTDGFIKAKVNSEGGGGSYTAGAGIAINEDNSINVLTGQGLYVNTNNFLASQILIQQLGDEDIEITGHDWTVGEWSAYGTLDSTSSAAILRAFSTGSKYFGGANMTINELRDYIDAWESKGHASGYIGQAIINVSDATNTYSVTCPEVAVDFSTVEDEEAGTTYVAMDIMCQSENGNIANIGYKYANYNSDIWAPLSDPLITIYSDIVNDAPGLDFATISVNNIMLHTNKIVEMWFCDPFQQLYNYKFVLNPYFRVI